MHVRIRCRAGTKHTCPKCGTSCPGYDSLERSWRHLDTCQFQTILVADVPRVKCPEHGVHQIHMPWSAPGSRFTALMEALVIDWLKEASISAGARMLHLSWDEVDGRLLSVGCAIEARSGQSASVSTRPRFRSATNT